ncbi:hypothetical protein AB0B25_08220 [Nocardia sp. NPDC049190]|uniref:hypothetical protein n=1 Tax=Nocardia sp. NPDC049190 TaxID=3155650 RepID=UPI0033C5D07E
MRAALRSAWPAERKKYPSRASKLDEFKPVIDEWLVADLDAPHKQRHTVRRIFARLIDEQRMTDVSYETVREYVSKRSRRSVSLPAAARPKCSFRRPTGPVKKRRSTSGKSPSSCAVR